MYNILGISLHRRLSTLWTLPKSDNQIVMVFLIYIIMIQVFKISETSGKSPN